MLCGIEAHVCVTQTCLDLLDKGFRVFVAADAVSSRTPENYRFGLDRMRAAGAVIVSTEMVLFELLGQAGTAEFKQILEGAGAESGRPRPGLAGRSSQASRAFDADVLVADHALGVVRLQGEGALAELAFEILAGLGAGRLDVLQHLLAVNQHGDAVALDDDLLGLPLAILGGAEADVDDALQAAGLDPVAMGLIDLALEPAAGPAFRLILGVEVNAAVRVGIGHHVHLEIEVLERLLVADVEQVAGLAARHKRAVLDLPGVLIGLRRLPAVEGLAVAEGSEAGLHFVRKQRGGCGNERGGY